jgi:FkbM family methyltransferase
VEPRVIYDVGSHVLHWTREARTVWPDAACFAFEAMDEVAPIYDEERVQYHLGVLSDQDDREVRFYVSPEYPSGNSYYRENPKVNFSADRHFVEGDARTLRATTLDTVARNKGWPLPDFIKMDVQGAEMDVLKGAQNCLRTCSDVILELQTVEYNRGAPLRDEVIAYMDARGFTLQDGPFYSGVYDGDYHFAAKRR